MLRIGGPLVALALLAWPAPAQGQKSVEQLRARWEQEADAVRKAKLMAELGNAEFRVINQEAAGGDTRAALAGLRQYRDEARQTVKRLDARPVDTEKHPGGFKQMQISLRESLREIDEVVGSLTANEQGPFLEVRKEIEEMNRHMVQELFPREPVGDVPPGKVK